MQKPDSDKRNPENTSSFYGENYFDWQKSVGAFGGWANSSKFTKSINHADTVVDFGCGGGYLLHNLVCARKIGIEPNASAAANLTNLGIESYPTSSHAISKLHPGFADVVISNHALEHTLNPIEEVKKVFEMLKSGGRAHFVVPCETISFKYKINDENHHLFSFSPQNLGNLFAEAGFEIVYSKPLLKKWPPGYKYIAKLGRTFFNLTCSIYARLERSWFQVEVLAIKP